MSWVPRARATPFIVISSGVGPNPPSVNNKAGLRSIASRTADWISRRESGIVVTLLKCQPCCLSRLAIQLLFVSSVCPIRISLPIVTISATGFFFDLFFEDSKLFVNSGKGCHFVVGEDNAIAAASAPTKAVLESSAKPMINRSLSRGRNSLRKRSSSLEEDSLVSLLSGGMTSRP